MVIPVITFNFISDINDFELFGFENSFDNNNKSFSNNFLAPELSIVVLPINDPTLRQFLM